MAFNLSGNLWLIFCSRCLPIEINEAKESARIISIACKFFMGKAPDGPKIFRLKAMGGVYIFLSILISFG